MSTMSIYSYRMPSYENRGAFLSYYMNRFAWVIKEETSMAVVTIVTAFNMGLVVV